MPRLPRRTVEGHGGVNNGKLMGRRPAGMGGTRGRDRKKGTQGERAGGRVGSVR